MSSAYSTEPPTRGKVVLRTSMGELELELWPKEAPKACRNFVQLCLEGYYDNTIFHRVLKGFLIQGGDPTGTGMGGESIYGKPFPCELHSRLRFNRRGILAMANTGHDDNTSQFFLTLDRADALQGKHSIFGKVVGDTIFNLLQIGELEVEEGEGEGDRPLFPARILGAEVLVNPFDDIVPRERRATPVSQPPTERQQATAPPSRRRARKNFNLLSFQAEDDGDQEGEAGDALVIKSKSIHDVAGKNARMRRGTPLPAVGDAEDKKEAAGVALVARPPSPLPAPALGITPPRPKSPASPSPRSSRSQEVNTDPGAMSHQDSITKLKQEIGALDRGGTSTTERQKSQSKPQSYGPSLVHQLRAAYTREGKAVQTHLRKHAPRAQPLDKLAELEAQLAVGAREAPVQPPSTGAAADDDMGDAAHDTNAPPRTLRNQECALHFIVNCLSCRDSFGEGEGEDEDINDASWMQEALVCKQPGAPRDGRTFAPTTEDYSLFDPLDPGAMTEGGPRKLETSDDFWREKGLPPAKRRAG